MKTTILEYVRERRKGKEQKVGVLLAERKGDKVFTGWSRCNLKEGDKFDQEQGINIAHVRLTHDDYVPQSMQKKMRRFQKRCSKYFKGATVIS